MKKIVISILLVSALQYAWSQDYEDLLKFSQSNQTGNARYSAMSGAFGSIGANASAMSINPAGSALLRGSLFEFTPEFTLTKTENHYLGNYDRAFTGSLKIPNIGFMSGKNIKESDLFITGVSFGFSINRQNLYNQTSNFNARNNGSSITDDFLRLANKDLWYSDYNDLAYDSKLIFFDTVSDMYVSDYRWYDGNVVKTQYGQDQAVNLKKSGSKREYLANFGIDFSQKVYLGANIAAESIFYTEDFKFTEIDNQQKLYYLSDFTYSKSTELVGMGVNAKVGVIVRPVEYLRLGLAAHSPSVYSMSTTTTSTLHVNYENYEVPNKSAENINEFDYQMLTPSKIVASLGFVYKNLAVLGVDYESVNYSYGYLNLNSPDEAARNQAIADNLTKTDNLKVGGELRYGPFSFRGGFATYGNPYSKYVVDDPFIRTDVSGGVGIGNDRFYCDIAWVRSNTKQYYSLYSNYSGSEVSSRTNLKRDNLLATIGFKF